ncbi:MAG: hypothetical protein U1E22_03730 [Coriobacteriia bacterium]|nr:hypothetical protein [Coriobacteriia bacterium]
MAKRVHFTVFAAAGVLMFALCAGCSAETESGEMIGLNEDSSASCYAMEGLPNCYAISAAVDTTWLACAREAEGGTLQIEVLDARSQQSLFTLNGAAPYVTTDGLYYVVGQDIWFRALDGDSTTCLETSLTAPIVRASPDSRYLYVQGIQGDSLRSFVFDTRAGREIPLPPSIPQDATWAEGDTLVLDAVEPSSRTGLFAIRDVTSFERPELLADDVMWPSANGRLIACWARGAAPARLLTVDARTGVTRALLELPVGVKPTGPVQWLDSQSVVFVVCVGDSLVQREYEVFGACIGVKGTPAE